MKTSDLSIFFDEDLAWDIREQFKDLITEGKTTNEATEILLADYKELLKDKYVPNIFWISLAATQWKYGRLLESIKEKAIDVIDSRRDLERWEHDEKLLSQRKKILEELKEMLLSPQPAPKKIKKQFVSTTTLETGDVISYKTESEKFVLIRVIGITMQGKGSYPIVEFLDWYGKDIPNEEKIKKLSVRKRAYTLAKNDEHNVYSLVHVKEKDYPKDKVTLVMKNCPTYYKKLLPNIMAFWNGLDQVLQRDMGFGVNVEEQLVNEQKKICERYSAKFTPTELDAMIGLSENTDGINIPINGLRHPPKGNTSGWYIWSGKEFSEKDDFFKPTHARHLKNKCSMVLKFLGLPPGYRFLYTGDNLDIWYDENLLDVE